MDAARHYRRSLAAIAVASTVLTIAFLLYDEAEAWGLILVVGLMIVCEGLLALHAKRSRCHKRYVQLRVLAECLRVEAYLHYGGCAARASEILPWSLRHDLGWIEDVLVLWEKEIHPLVSGKARDSSERAQMRTARRRIRAVRVRKYAQHAKRA